MLSAGDSRRVLPFITPAPRETAPDAPDFRSSSLIFVTFSVPHPHCLSKFMLFVLFLDFIAIHFRNFVLSIFHFILVAHIFCSVHLISLLLLKKLIYIFPVLLCGRAFRLEHDRTSMTFDSCRHCYCSECWHVADRRVAGTCANNWLTRNTRLTTSRRVSMANTRPGFLTQIYFEFSCCE